MNEGGERIVPVFLPQTLFRNEVEIVTYIVLYIQELDLACVYKIIFGFVYVNPRKVIYTLRKNKGAIYICIYIYICV